MKIAIVTSFNKFDAGYSLTGIVKSQIRMFQKYDNHVELFVMEKFSDKDFEAEFPDIVINKIFPFHHMKDYQSLSELTAEHKQIAVETFERFEKHIKNFDAVIEHDLWFQGWHLPLNLGILSSAERHINIPFFHFVHSIPSGYKDTWDSRNYSLNNFIVYPNKSDALQCAENFRTQTEKILCIPHILDVREFWDFSDEAKAFIDKYNLINADIIQVFPASTDKLSWKKIDMVIKIFGALKRKRYDVKLIIANQFATTTGMKEKLDTYKELAEQEGLGKDLIFTSEYSCGKYEYGISKTFIRELMMLSNLFIFPTHGESFGLIVPEVSLSSGALLVLNRSLQQQIELSGNFAVYLDFGSHSLDHKMAVDTLDQYANIILSHMVSDRAVMTRTYIRQNYNMDNLYRKYYLPVIMEKINVCTKLMPVKGVSDAD